MDITTEFIKDEIYDEDEDYYYEIFIARSKLIIGEIEIIFDIRDIEMRKGDLKILREYLVNDNSEETIISFNPIRYSSKKDENERIIMFKFGNRLEYNNVRVHLNDDNVDIFIKYIDELLEYIEIKHNVIN